MLGLVLVLALTQTPQHRLQRQPNLPRGSIAFFEFAPASGKGMTTPCLCATPTGARGEVLTFARASSGTCLKVGTTTGIANGDMVTCTNDQPRVMPGGDGSGGSGLLVEGARTNFVLRSQELENAAWTLTANGVANPTVTANQAVAPDGTTTAERVQIPATSGAQYSLLQQSGFTATANSATIFVKGNGTSGSICVAVGSGANNNCLCNFVSATWTRCSCENKTSGADNFYFGNYSGAGAGGACAGVSFSANDVFVWGAQGENGAGYASSYIATAGSTVARAAETATFPNPGAAVLAGGSAAATVLASTTSSHGIVCFAADGRPLYLSTTTARWYDGTTNPNISVGTLSALIPKRFWSSWTGAASVVANATDSTSSGSTFDGALGFSAFTMGNGCSVGSDYGILLKRLCLDPAPARCR